MCARLLTTFLVASDLFVLLLYYFYFVCILYFDSLYTVSQKNPCDYVFDDNLNSKRPIVIIFGTIISVLRL